jgi:Ran GTPase-activating protein 1
VVPQKELAAFAANQYFSSNMDAALERITALETRLAAVEADNVALRAEIGGGSAAGGGAVDDLAAAMGRVAVHATKDLTTWVSPLGAQPPAEGEFKMDFEGKRERVEPARAVELLAAAAGQPAGRTNFTKVALANKSYTHASAQEVAKVLKTFTDAKVADLADIIAGQMEVEALKVLTTISDSLGHLDLMHIDLSDNALGEKGVRACSAILLGKQCLEELKFNNNGISAECAAVIEEIVLSVNPTKLRMFHFHNNMSGPGGAVHLGSIIENSPLMTDIRFSGTRALRDGSVAFAACVQRLAAKQHAGGAAGLFVSIDLADNTFGGVGGASLAAALTNQPNLTSLNLRDCALEDEGTEAVMGALKDTAPALVFLDMSGNEIEGSMAAVAECIGTKPLLQFLGLDDNEFGDDGAQELAGALVVGASKATLSHLSLMTTETHAEGAMAVANAIAGYSALTSLGFNGNMISEEGLEGLKAAIDANGHTGALVPKEDPWEDNDPDAD